LLPLSSFRLRGESRHTARHHDVGNYTLKAENSQAPAECADL